MTTAAAADIRICFIGDSFVNGTGDRTYLGWTGRLCRAAAAGHSVTYYNLGVRRETSADIAARWQGEASCRLPKSCDGRIVFSFGVNDTTLEEGKPRVEQSATLRNAGTMLMVAKRQYPVLMVSPVPIADDEQNCRTAQLLDPLAELCDGLNVPYLDVFTPLRQSTVWMQEVIAGDGAHPDAGGYAEYTRIVQHWSAWQRWFNDDFL